MFFSAIVFILCRLSFVFMCHVDNGVLLSFFFLFFILLYPFLDLFRNWLEYCRDYRNKGGGHLVRRIYCGIRLKNGFSLCFH